VGGNGIFTWEVCVCGAGARFYVPRDELQQVLAEYKGPYGNIAEFEEDVRERLVEAVCP
jgi:hypothetical protein